MKQTYFKWSLPAMLVAVAVPFMSGQITDRRTSSDPAASVRVVASAEGSASARNLKKRVRGNFRTAPMTTPRSTPAKAAPSATPTFHVTLYDYDDELGTGLYTFTPGSDTFTPVSVNDAFDSEYGGVLAGNVFFNIDGTGKAHKWDPYTWTETASGASEFINSTAMAYSDGGAVYACVYPMTIGSQKLEDGMMLVTVDTDEFVRASTVGKLTEGLSAMFFKNNTLYGIGSSSGTLYTVNTETAALTTVGATGIDLCYGGSVGTDPASGAVFVAANGNDAVGLYELSVSDASATLIQEFTNDLVVYTMFVPAEKPSDDVPAAATEATFNFIDASLSGNIEITAPTLSFGGSTLDGELTYSVIVNDGDPVTGSVMPGAKISVPYTADSDGICEVSATFANAAGKSQTFSTSAWIGKDTPKPVANVKFTRQGNVNTVTWDPVTGGVHNGYVDIAGLTYTVTRSSDNKEFTGLTETTLTDEVPDPAIPEQVTYSVCASAGGKSSEPTASNYVMAGAVYYNAFDTREDFNTMSSRSLHGPLLGEDAPTWEWNSWRNAADVDSEESRTKEAWLTSPAIRMEGGKEYNLSFRTWGSHDEYTELLSAYITDTPDIATNYQNRTPLLDKIQVNWTADAAQTKTVPFTPGTSGQYYIMFRACSSPDLGTLYVDDILLAKAPVVALPAAPTVTAIHDGNLGVTVTVTAPALDTEGGQLSSPLKITLQRDGTTVKVFDNTAPGKALTFTETLPGEASYVYSATAENGNGRSESASFTIVTATPGVPAAPSGLNIAETSTDGEVTLSWLAPRVDVKGHPVNESELTYSIYPAGSNEAVATGLTGTTHTFTAVSPDRQEFVSYTVAAVNSVGEGNRSTATKPLPVGRAATMPYTESFASMRFTNPWLAETDDYSEARWMLVESSATPKAMPQDGDGGMLAFEAEFLDERATLNSGKISIGNDAVLSFWYFAQNSKDGKDELSVQVIDGTETRVLDRFSMRDEQKDGWTNRTVSLDKYAGKTIRLSLTGNSYRTENLMLLDNFVITTSGVDMEATSILAPSAAEPGVEFPVDAFVTNIGTKAASGVSVKLLRDDEEIASENCGDIAAGQSRMVRFIQTADQTWPREVKYSFVITAPDDTDPTNNTSVQASVEIKSSTLPGVGRHSAVYNDDSHSAVTVEWTAPDFDAIAPVEHTESFEHYPTFTVNPDLDWTFVDGDGAPTYGISGLNFPDANKPMAFVNIDSYGITGENFSARSGSKFLASFDAQPDGGTNVVTDDWMISPLLDGKAQEISFWANSYTDRYGLESVEVLVSTTDTKTDSFTKVFEIAAVPKGWTNYKVQLAEGAKYFAIRNVSENHFALFIDDVTYTPARHHASWYKVTGYNVYRDGARINDKPVPGLSFVDSSLPAATPRYAVSVVYECGESGLSEYITPSESGIDGVSAGGVTVHTGNGMITVSTSSNTRILISDSLGSVIFNGTVSGKADIPAASGVYLVKTPGGTRKVLVK